MKRFVGVFVLLIMVLSVSGCGGLSSNKQGKSSGSWAYEKMISLNGVNYVVTSENIKKVDNKLGEIKHYSTDEKDFNSDNFSNYCKVGAKLYSIPETSTKDAIAVETEKNQFYKAVNVQSLNK